MRKNRKGTRRASALHAASEPATLTTPRGERLQRGVYSFTSPTDEGLFVAVGSTGKIVASIEIPKTLEPKRMADLDDVRNADAYFHEAIGHVWMALEMADPIEETRYRYPAVVMLSAA